MFPFIFPSMLSFIEKSMFAYKYAYNFAYTFTYAIASLLSSKRVLGEAYICMSMKPSDCNLIY